MCYEAHKHGPTSLARQALYSVYVHIPPNGQPMSNDSMFAPHVIDKHVLAQRFSHTMIDVRVWIHDLLQHSICDDAWTARSTGGACAVGRRAA